MEDSGELIKIYEDGKFYNQTTLDEIRAKLNKIIESEILVEA